MDTEKVIKGLENCLHYKGHCLDCPYNSPNCQNDVLKDAVALLKEQDNEIDTLKTLLLGYETGAIKGNNDAFVKKVKINECNGL